MCEPGRLGSRSRAAEKEGKRERGKEGKRERGKEGKRERGKEGKRQWAAGHHRNLGLSQRPPMARGRRPLRTLSPNDLHSVPFIE
jgi:hypothetical protein